MESVGASLWMTSPPLRIGSKRFCFAQRTMFDRDPGVRHAAGNDDDGDAIGTETTNNARGVQLQDQNVSFCSTRRLLTFSTAETFPETGRRLVSCAKLFPFNDLSSTRHKIGKFVAPVRASLMLGAHTNTRATLFVFN